jgi:hypothetical protein
LARILKCEDGARYHKIQEFKVEGSVGIKRRKSRAIQSLFPDKNRLPLLTSALPYREHQ